MTRSGVDPVSEACTLPLFFSRCTLVSAWMWALSPEDVLGVMFLQSCPGCVRTSDWRSVVRFRRRWGFKMLVVRLQTARVHLCAGRQKSSSSVQTYESWTDSCFFTISTDKKHHYVMSKYQISLVHYVMLWIEGCYGILCVHYRHLLVKLCIAFKLIVHSSASLFQTRIAATVGVGSVLLTGKMCWYYLSLVGDCSFKMVSVMVLPCKPTIIYINKAKITLYQW